MRYLKEDGSLDVRHIDMLPLDEYTKAIANLTTEQYNEYMSYVSKQPIYESKGSLGLIEVDYSLNEDIERNGLISADEFLEKIRNI